jgi:hypothetical protein
LLKLDYDAAHRFVDGYPNASWDGYTIELFKPTNAGYSSKRGAFRNGRWGFLTRVEANEQGRWVFRV